MSKKLLICFVMLLTYVSTALAQTKISGTVVGAEDNQPVIGATIMVVGTKAGVVTDVDGKFSLTTDVANPQVTVGYIGMVSQTLKGTTDMKVVLKSSTQALKEVVVTGLTPHRPPSLYGCYRQGRCRQGSSKWCGRHQ